MPEPNSTSNGGGSDRGGFPLRKCDNPWRPNAQHGQSEVYRRMLGILNRVTQQSLDVCLDQAYELPLADPEYLPHILEIVLSKAQDEPIFSQIYARMCSEIGSRLCIQSDIQSACEKHFFDSYQHLLSFGDISQVPVTYTTIREEILTRKRFVGHLRFMSELQKLGAVSADELAILLESFLMRTDDRTVESLCRLLSFCGQRLQNTHANVIERSMEYIVSRRNTGSLSPRLSFLTQDILDLRSNGWRPRTRPGFPNGRDVRG